MARSRSASVSSDEDHHSQEHQTCYLFTPPNASPRPSKRRRSNPPLEEEACPFPPLLAGHETPTAIHQRWSTYRRLWAAQEARTKAILESFNQATLDDVAAFVKDTGPEKVDGKIPTALVLTGPNIAAHAPLFAQLATRIRDVDQTGPVVVLSSRDGGGLKGVLRKVIREAVEEEEDEEERGWRRGGKQLPYDLQILHDWCLQHPGRKVVIAVQDTEAFDAFVLSDLVSLFSSYLDRIPFVLLLGIATSLEIFHEKLPKATIRLMRGEKFDVERAEECLARVFNDAVLGEDAVLRLGAAVCDLLIDRQKNHTQSIQTFVAALKYAYMSHFYANPLSIVLGFVGDPEGLQEALSDLHLEAVRNLPSFRRYVESHLADHDTAEVRKLLTDDAHLRTVIAAAATDCNTYALHLGHSLEVLDLTRSTIPSSSPRLPRYELLPRVLSGDLHPDSPSIRNLLLSIKKLNSTTLLTLITALSRTPLAPILTPYATTIATLGPNLTSEFDLSSTSTLRSTAVSKKIQLSAARSGLTKNDAAYTQLLQEVHDAFADFFAASLYPVQDLLLHEVFFYDLVSPHKDVFAPRARAAVERALARPGDYLACECCEVGGEEVGGEGDGVRASHPPTCVVYQMYLEGGALVNSFDLWSAFRSVVVGEEGEGEGEERTAQALFYRSVAEMRFLGFVKQTRKRVDHLQKLAWKGL